MGWKRVLRGKPSLVVLAAVEKGYSWGGGLSNNHHHHDHHHDLRSQPRLCYAAVVHPPGMDELEPQQQHQLMQGRH